MKKLVLVVVRFDALSKNGGDFQMMRSFAKQLENQFEVKICYGVPNFSQIRSSAAVLATNIDRPIESWKTMLKCRSAGVPFVIYTLHHPHDGIQAYLRHGAHGFKAVTARLALYNPVRYEQLLWFVRLSLAKIRGLGKVPYGSVSAAQKSLLTLADAVVCCSQNEIDILEKDIRHATKSYIVPHPSDAPKASNTEKVPGRIVVAGRIEARKNQITALKIAREMPDSDFVFVGSPVPSEKKYFSKFESLLKQTKNASYMNDLPKSEFYSFLASAEIVLNSSYFEVTSLIDIWCIENEIPLVTTRYTYIDGTGAFAQFDPTSVDDGIVKLKKTIDLARNSGKSVKALREVELKIGDVMEKVL